MHQNDVERRYAIHENRLASVKASLALSAPPRLEFMDKRLSKNYHTRRQQAAVVHENLKLLRALEEIHSRPPASGFAGGEEGSIVGGPKRGRPATTAGSSGPVGGVGDAGEGRRRGNTVRKGKLHSKKLHTLLARKRDQKASVVARENEKMMEVRNMVVFVHYEMWFGWVSAEEC